MRIHIRFSRPCSITYYEYDSNKVDRFCGTDVARGETLSIFKEIIKATTSEIWLVCYDDSKATIPLDAIQAITIE